MLSGADLDVLRTISCIVIHFFITARNELAARLCFHRCLWFCSQVGVCVAGRGMHGGGLCGGGRGCAWQGTCVVGRCVAEGHVLGGACISGGIHGRRDGHFSGRYASCCNAFLFWLKICVPWFVPRIRWCIPKFGSLSPNLAMLTQVCIMNL